MASKATTADHMASTDPLLTSSAVRQELGGIAEVTLWRWIQQGVMPAPIYITNRRYWRRSVIEELKSGSSP